MAYGRANNQKSKSLSVPWVMLAECYGFTYEDMSDLTGINIWTLKKYGNAGVEPSVGNAILIANTLDSTVEQLFGGFAYED